MSLVFAAACTHGPGITARPERADPTAQAGLDAAYADLRERLAASRPDALFIIAAEHFANFFMNNMPGLAVGMADYYDGPLEDDAWLRIAKTRAPGNADLSRRLIDVIIEDCDIAYAEEWKLDHGIMVPLHHLTPDYDLPIIPANINCQAPPMPPLKRAHVFGQAVRKACDSVPERIAVIATGGISHWPCTPDSGKVNAVWDLDFLERWKANDVAAMCAYTDQEVYRDGGQGGFEIRTFVALAGAAGGEGQVLFYEPIPAFACGCPIAVMSVV